MAMRAKGEIVKIFRPRKNGMYTDNYTVFYENGMTREFRLSLQNPKMCNKHFNFIMNAKVERVENKSGTHVADRFFK